MPDFTTASADTAPPPTTLQIDQGQDWSATLTITPQGQTTPMNLTGYSAHMQIRDRAGGNALYADLSTDSGGITLDSTGTVLTMTLTAAQTLTFPAPPTPPPVFDLALVDTNGHRAFVWDGSIVVRPEVTVS